MMYLIYVDFNGYPQTLCIHLIDSSVDGRLYTLLACWTYFLEFRFGLHGFHCLWLCFNGIRYLPHSSRFPMRMDFLWHVINTSSSLYTVTPSLVNMETLPSLAVLTTLIKDVGGSLNVSDSVALLESWGKGSLVTYLPLHAPPLATPTFLADMRNIGRPNLFLSFLLS